MKQSSVFPLVLLAAAACSTTGGGSPSLPDLVYWPPGRYVLEASVRYDQATSFEEHTVEEVYVAQLIVTPNGSLILTTSFAACEQPPLAERSANESAARKTFECGDVTYHLWPEEERLAGEIVASVREETRERGECIRYRAGVDGQDRCVESPWMIEARTVDKRARLKVSMGS